MTSKKEKRAAGLAKREEFLKKEKEAGLLAQKRDRERRAAEESARDSTRRTNEWQKIMDEAIDEVIEIGRAHV